MLFHTTTVGVEVNADDKKAVKEKEKAILQLCELLGRENDAAGKTIDRWKKRKGQS